MRRKVLCGQNMFMGIISSHGLVCTGRHASVRSSSATLNQPSHEVTPFSMDTSPSPEAAAAAGSLPDPNMADSKDLMSLTTRL